MDTIHDKNLFNPNPAQHIRINHQFAVANERKNTEQLMVVFFNPNLTIRLVHDKVAHRIVNIARIARQQSKNRKFIFYSFHLITTVTY